MTGSVIKLSDVSFAYDGGARVLSGVSLSVAAGERLALLGPVGCGKTTLLHIIVGLLKPTSGTVWAFGEVRREEADFHEVRRRVGLVFQDADDQLFCPTVIEDVAFGPLNLGKTADEALAIAGDTLALLGLGGFEERVTYDLSGGEKRLVSIATVLAMDPEVLLLDEPTCGLDDKSNEVIATVLERLGQAMIIVSHEKPFVERLAGRVIEMEGGALVTRQGSRLPTA